MRNHACPHCGATITPAQIANQPERLHNWPGPGTSYVICGACGMQRSIEHCNAPGCYEPRAGGRLCEGHREKLLTLIMLPGIATSGGNA